MKDEGRRRKVGRLESFEGWKVMKVQRFESGRKEHLKV